MACSRVDSLASEFTRERARINPNVGGLRPAGSTRNSRLYASCWGRYLRYPLHEGEAANSQVGGLPALAGLLFARLTGWWLHPFIGGRPQTRRHLIVGGLYIELGTLGKGMAWGG